MLRPIQIECWLGVTMYLTRDEVFATLRSLAGLAPAGSTVVFDYYDACSFRPAAADLQTLELRAKLHEIGEPMQTGFDPSTLAADLAAAGFRLLEDAGHPDRTACPVRTCGFAP